MRKPYQRIKNIILIVVILFAFKFYMIYNKKKLIDDKKKFIVFDIKVGHGWGDKLEGQLKFNFVRKLLGNFILNIITRCFV